MLQSQPVSAASQCGHSNALKGRHIMMKWEGFGWMRGSITQVNEDARRAIDGKKINFFVLYEGEEEDGPVPHMLDMARYQTEEDAEYDSWFLLEPLVEGTGADAADEVVPMEQV
jgi:hypothetical protein